jgi:ABC-type dipeptide/oligopeptide/nickel transport system permease component
MSALIATVINRLVNSIFVVVMLSIVVFGFMRAIPGDPVVTMLGGEQVSQEQIAELRAELGLDRPLYVQYLSWGENVLRGDLGRSLKNHEPVLPILMQRLKATAELAFAAIVIGALVGVGIGTLAAVKRGTIFDTATMIAALSGISMPVFWVGLLLIVVFSVAFNLFPTGGMLSFSTRIQPVTGFPLLDSLLTGNGAAALDILSHMVLPALTLALAPAALIARTTRASVLEVINEDYVTAGLARGLSYGGVILRHVMRNAMIPVITIIGLEIGVYLGGSIVTETVFAWPGLGRYMMEAIMGNDYPVVQGAILIYALIIIVVNLLVDLTYGVIDPRVRS